MKASMAPTKLRIPKQGGSILAPEEVGYIISNVSDLMIRTALTLCYCMALRPLEVVSLRIADFNPHSKRLIIRGGKAGKLHEVPLSNEAFHLINDWLRVIHRGTWMFPCNDHHLTVADLQRAFKKAYLQSGILKPASIGTLRHSIFYEKDRYPMGHPTTETAFAAYIHDAQLLSESMKKGS